MAGSCQPRVRTFQAIFRFFRCPKMGGRLWEPKTTNNHKNGCLNALSSKLSKRLPWTQEAALPFLPCTLVLQIMTFGSHEPRFPFHSETYLFRLMAESFNCSFQSSWRSFQPVGVTHGRILSATCPNFSGYLPFLSTAPTCKGTVLVEENRRIGGHFMLGFP